MFLSTKYNIALTTWLYFPLHVTHNIFSVNNLTDKELMVEISIGE